jgi:hypothetical protein
VPEQSEEARQRTHVLLAVSQTGAVVVVHWLFDVHPARHCPFPPQMGVVPLHCELVTHWTQPPLLQCGVAPEQSESVAHWTQVCVASQTWRVVGQSEPVMQPTHAPFAGSQIGVALAQRVPAPPSGEHAARQT